MYIKEIITEISKAERDRRREAERREKLAQQQAAKAADDKRIKDIANRKLSKTLPHAITSPKPDNSKPSSGAFSSSEFDQYRVDDTIDTDWEGGFYLRFLPQKNSILAYWGKSDQITPEHAKTIFKQTKQLSLDFNETEFQSLVDQLVSATEHNGQPGYVSIEIQRNHFIPPYKDFFEKLHMYLLEVYPQKGETLDPSVNWEIIP